MAYTMLVELQLKEPLMFSKTLLGPVIWVSVLMWGQSWHLGLLQGVVPLF